MHRGEQGRFDAWSQLEDGEQPLDCFLRRGLSRRSGGACCGLYRRSAVRVELQEYVDRAALELSLQPSPECVYCERIVLVLELPKRGSLARDHGTGEVVDEAREECFLVDEMVMNEPLAHAGVSRDLAQCERGSATRRDAMRRRVEDPLHRGVVSVFGTQTLLLAAARPLEHDRQADAVL